ncbi:MAG: UDP-4-amino-4,6-dideoxy-N-acetyl-beta-L-altrosamine transaminase, partial [Nitrospirota bacterium]|nr:UDP-4-amino-4,6-dideoxy-N-acetyl-beta-L-altrosamine transaminase [Nitrospirota bacterium]
AEFEKKVANYCGVKYAVAVSSGTAALHLACLAAGISGGDEVITSPITFVASANCALYVGARPVFADIRPDTYCIDAGEIRKKLTSKTKAVIPVDFAGHPCDIDDINSIARERGLVVIEDAAHSLGAEFKGQKVGCLADMTVFSFHPVKHITTGEGGMVVTNRKDFYDKLVLLRSHGITRNQELFVQPCSVLQPSTLNPQPSYPEWYYEMQELGFNYRITDFQCALGISQMDKLDGFVQRLRGIAEAYDQAFQGIDELITPVALPDCKSSYHLYPIQFRTVSRNEAFSSLREKGIGVSVHYIPVHLQPYYRKTFGYGEGDFPVAEEYFSRCLSLPIHQGMTDEEISYVIDGILTVAKEISK